MDDHHQKYLAELVRRADDAVARHGLDGVRAEVVLVLDVSKSMYAMYKSHAIHELATRLLALSLEFDDDGVIPAYAFGDACRHLGDLTVSDFAGWVEREVIRTGSDFQSGCRYAPAIHEVCSYFFPEDWHRPTRVTQRGLLFKRTATEYPRLSAPRALPVYALFVTSGDCQDQAAATDAVRRSSRLPIFWQFVGLQSGRGPRTRFHFLEKLDKLGNTHVDNCGFFEVTDTRNDKALFDGMAQEFPHYLRTKQVRAMLRPEAEGGLRTKGVRSVPVVAEVVPAPREVLAAASDEALERARRRRLLEQRVLPSDAPVWGATKHPPRTGNEPTTTLAPLSTRTIRAVSEAQARAALAARDPSPERSTSSRPVEAHTVIRAAVVDDDDDAIAWVDGVDDAEDADDEVAAPVVQRERTAITRARLDEDPEPDTAPHARPPRPQPRR